MASKDASKYAGFATYLAEKLPIDTSLRVHHISTAPTSTAPLFASSTAQTADPTTCESHFLTLSRALAQTNEEQYETESTAKMKSQDHRVLVMGIEVLIFTTQSLTTVFVSKADSTGFLTRSTVDAGSSIIRITISAFLEWLVQRHLSGPVSHETDQKNDDDQQQNSSSRRLVLSLFARAQNQYLFPGSVENASKHVLDDRQLIKWWCKVLDSLVKKDWKIPTRSSILSKDGRDKEAADQSQTIAPQAYVVVPGCDKHEVVRSFYPLSAKSSTESRWHVKYPVEYLVGDQHKDLPIRCAIPRFPDDPKARYCEDLDGPGMDENGHWRGVKTLQQFWETMEYRQECASGRLVGFIWLTFGLLPLVRSQSDLTDSQQVNANSEHEVDQESQQTLVPDTPAVSNLQDCITLSSGQYNDQADCLINETDFAGDQLAVKSTNDWIEKIKDLAGVSSFGVDVVGRKTYNVSGVNLPVAGGAADMKDKSNDAEPKVNVLMGVRKKRKVEEASNNVVPVNTETSAETSVAELSGSRSSPIKTLSAGLIRKKPKTST